MIDRGYVIQKILFGMFCFGIPIIYVIFDAILNMIKSNRRIRNVFSYGSGFVLLLFSLGLGIFDLTGIFEQGYGEFWRFSRILILFGIGVGLFLYQNGRADFSKQGDTEKIKKRDLLHFFSKYLVIISMMFIVLLK